MGYNRGGTRRSARLKRRKRLETRLARKAAEPVPAKESLTGKAKGMAKSAVEKVGGALHAAVEKVKNVVKK